MANGVIPINNIRLVFSDFDGTLTEEKNFSPFFLGILNYLEKRETPLVIVTGRSKSWAHFFLTHFPTLKTVVSEGGGVISVKDSRGIIEDKLMVSQDEVRRLKSFIQQLKQKFPKLKLSTDSFGRETDRAIEFSCMDDKIKNFVIENNINFSTSNVHFNFWCGEISKYKAVSFLLEHYYSFSPHECIYFGDSLNDESMFQHFENSVGVSNITEYLEHLQYIPKVILDGEENRGAEGVYRYLSTVLK